MSQTPAPRILRAGAVRAGPALAAVDSEPDPDELARLAAPYRCDADVPGTTQPVERNGLPR